MASNFLPNSNYQLPDISSHTRSRFAGRLFRPINARYQYLEGSAIWPLAKCSRIRLISYNYGPLSVSDDINWPSCAHIHMGLDLLATDMFPWFPLSGWNTAEGIHSVRARRQLARHAPTMPPPTPPPPCMLPCNQIPMPFLCPLPPPPELQPKYAIKSFKSSRKYLRRCWEN